MDEPQVILQGASNAFDILRQQLEILLVYLYRDSVREQLVFVITLLIGSLVASHGLYWMSKRAVHRIMRNRSGRLRNFVVDRLLPAIGQLYYPVLIVLGFGTAQVSGSGPGLLVGLLLYVLLLMGYRLLVAVLYLVWSRQRFRRYHHRVLAPLFYIMLVTVIAGALVDLRLVSSIELLTIYQTPITVGRLASAILSFYIFVVAAWIIQDALQLTLERLEQRESTRRSVLTVSRFLTITLGILMTLVALGFNIATLAAIAGGLSLGAGLGLQSLIGNFVSGIVLIFEQSVRPGDMIEYNGTLGLVERLNIRATTLRTFDNVDLIIPNENLLNSAVITHVNEIARKRVTINVGVSYDNDPGQIRALLVETALRHGLVLKNPEPFAYFRDYGDSGLRFTLWAWVGSLDKRFLTENDLRYMIWEELSSKGIQIAHPLREIYVKNDPGTGSSGIQPEQQ